MSETGDQLRRTVARLLRAVEAYDGGKSQAADERNARRVVAEARDLIDSVHKQARTIEQMEKAALMTPLVPPDQVLKLSAEGAAILKGNVPGPWVCYYCDHPQTDRVTCENCGREN